MALINYGAKNDLSKHPTGIPYVVVNGTIVVKDSRVLKGVYPGKAIRRTAASAN